jgi:hypothetical protein
MKLCIEQTPEGFAVYIEGQEPQMAASVDEALELGRSMLGGGEQTEPEPMMEGEDQMQAAFAEGFNKDEAVY